MESNVPKQTPPQPQVNMSVFADLTIVSHSPTVPKAPIRKNKIK